VQSEHFFIYFFRIVFNVVYHIIDLCESAFRYFLSINEYE